MNHHLSFLFLYRISIKNGTIKPTKNTPYCFFKLKHPKRSQLEQAFLAAVKKLAAIPGVEEFECLKQISKKNKFEFGLSMEFANQQLYDTYNNHPDHVAFIQNHWLKEVEDFLEIDYEVLK